MVIKKHTMRLLTVVIAIFSSVFTIIYLDSMWSGSADFAHHYALTFRIYENWTLPTVNDPSLGDMQFYPRAAHIIAAMLGSIFGSALLGIQLVVLLSTALLWASFVFIIASVEKRLAHLWALLFATLLVLNRLYIGLEIHASEIVGNYFFSQMVAQSVVLVAITAGIYLELQKHNEYKVLWLLLLFTWVVTKIHLLPALELGSVVILLALIRVGIIVEVPKGIRLVGATWPYFGIIVLILLIVISSPEFTEMKRLAGNDGVLRIKYVQSITGLVVLAIFVFAQGAYLLWEARKRYVDGAMQCVTYKYLGIYGISISILCMVQIVLLLYGLGSEYATKKYVFGMYTFSFASTSLLLALRIRAPNDLTYVGKRYGISTQSIILLTIAFVIAFISSLPLPQNKVYDTSDLIGLERKLIGIRQFIVDDSKAKSNVVIGLRSMNNTINYMFSIAIFKTPMAVAIHDILIGNSISDLTGYSNIVTSRNSRPYYRFECESFLSIGEITAVDAECMSRVLGPAKYCSGTFDLSANGYVSPKMISGFSDAWDQGRWTVGKVATFTCEFPSDKPQKLTITASPFVFGDHRSQKLRINVGSETKEYVLNDEKKNAQLVVDLVRVESSRAFQITIETPDAISPKEVGYNEDTRLLGVNVRSLRFE